MDGTRGVAIGQALPARRRIGRGRRTGRRHPRRRDQRPARCHITRRVGEPCLYAFITGTKQRLKLDDSLDVFGIHGLGGIVGSIGTAIAALPILGGHAAADYALGKQLAVQAGAVGIAILWSGIGSAIAFLIVRLLMPLRRSHDEEREGLDLTEHGERAYNP